MKSEYLHGICNRSAENHTQGLKMDSCIFCQIVNGQSSSHIVDESDEFLAFLSIFPNTLGVTVVIPKKHYPSYAFDLDDQILARLVCFSKRVAKRLDHYFEDVGRTAMVFEGFGVDHVHAKLFPMHGTQQYQQNWQVIQSSVNRYFEKYEGFISSHDYIQAEHNELAQLAAQLRNFKF